MYVDELRHHGWVLGLLSTWGLAAWWWTRSRPHRLRDLSLVPRFLTLVRGALTWGTLPWLIMGTADVLDLVHPGAFMGAGWASPLVVAFDVSFVALCAVGARWVMWQDGAELMAAHLDVFNPLRILGPRDPGSIAVFHLFGICGALLALGAMRLGF